MIRWRCGGDGAVLIVEDNARLLATLARNLGRTRDVIPCASAADAFQAAAAPDSQPSAAIVDIGLGGRLDGIEVVRRLRERWGRLPALVMTGAASLDSDAVDRLARLGAGVWFGRKPQVALELGRFLDLAAVVAVLDVPDATELAEVVLAEAVRAGLTETERRLLAHIARGTRNADIAARLKVKLPTVKTHVHHVLEKTGHRDVRALRRALLDGDAGGRAGGGGVRERTISSGRDED